MEQDDALLRIPVTDVVDLHTVRPQDVKEAVEAYLEEANRLGLKALRIIYGRGIGVQRETVRAVLARTPFVLSFQDDPLEAGGWGATIVTLRTWKFRPALKKGYPAPAKVTVETTFRLF